MLIEDRNCGIEVEFNYNTNKIKALGETTHRIKAIPGISVLIDYDEIRFDRISQRYDFHFTSDSSIVGCGTELQTRPFKLRDEKFIDVFRFILLCLRNAKGYTDKTCGLHIHVSALDFDFRDIKNLTMFFGSWQHVLFSIVAPNRRYGIYSIPFSTALLDILDKCYRLSQFEDEWSRNIDRYLCLNLEPWFMYRHYEIRFCHGLLNSQRILNWANLQLHIAQYIKSIRGFTTWHKKHSSVEKLEDMLKLINFPEAIDYFTDEYDRYTSLAKEKDTQKE